jgi:peptidoglycan-N-acetylglucosamine deacetylase
VNEAGVLLAIILTLISSGLYMWRRAAGHARRRYHLVGRIAILSLVIIPLVLLSTYGLMNARTFQVFGQLVPSVNTSRPIVALTFDDGPQPLYTSHLLSVLREKDAHATFFVIGMQLEKYPALAEEIVRDGHELGNHSYSHQRMIFKSLAFIRGEIERTDRLIRRAGYAGEIHFRSPYGKKLFLLPLYLSTTDRKNIFIDVDPDSHPDVAASAEKIVEYVLAKVKPGSIIILHAENSRRAESLEAVPGIIDGLKSRGYGFVTVSELLRSEGDRYPQEKNDGS